jgi:hypothetical protein
LGQSRLLVATIRRNRPETPRNPQERPGARTVRFLPASAAKTTPYDLSLHTREVADPLSPQATPRLGRSLSLAPVRPVGPLVPVAWGQRDRHDRTAEKKLDRVWTPSASFGAKGTKSISRFCRESVRASDGPRPPGHNPSRRTERDGRLLQLGETVKELRRRLIAVDDADTGVRS